MLSPQLSAKVHQTVATEKKRVVIYLQRTGSHNNLIVGIAALSVFFGRKNLVSGDAMIQELFHQITKHWRQRESKKYGFEYSSRI